MKIRMRQEQEKLNFENEMFCHMYFLNKDSAM